MFSTKGKTVVQDGWKALVQKNDSTKSDENVQTLPSVSVGDEMTVSGTEIKEGKTSPPKHFTEDTLLSAMETAGADEMPDEVERKGLGTPATRAGIIEKLVRIGFLMADSTNAEKEGFTQSEKTVGRTFDNLFNDNKDHRIIIATFASNVDFYIRR